MDKSSSICTSFLAQEVNNTNNNIENITELGTEIKIPTNLHNYFIPCFIRKISNKKDGCYNFTYERSYKKHIKRNFNYYFRRTFNNNCIFSRSIS